MRVWEKKVLCRCGWGRVKDEKARRHVLKHVNRKEAEERATKRSGAEKRGWRGGRVNNWCKKERGVRWKRRMEVRMRNKKMLRWCWFDRGGRRPKPREEGGHSETKEGQESKVEGSRRSQITVKLGFVGPS